jgi:hypothetical protein
MKIQWMAAALLSSSLIVACGEKKAENEQIPAQNEGTSVAVAPEAGGQANLQAPAQQPAATSPNRDASAARTNTPAVRPAPRQAARPAPAAAPIDRDEVRFTPAPAARTAPAVRVITLPVGTTLPLELTTAVSSETAQVEQAVSARLRRAVTVDGVTVLPAGSVVNGEVSDVDRAGRVQGRARLGLRFTSVTIGGRREELRTNPVTFEGEASKGEDATKIGAGAGIGAAIGGILGGGKGAVKGAAIGGAAGTGAVLATRGKEVELAAGADVDPTLASPVDIEVK